MFDGMKFIPAVVSSIVDPATGDEHQIIGFEIASSVEVTVVAGTRRPCCCECCECSRKKWQGKDGKDGAKEPSDKGNLADGIMEGTPERIGGRTNGDGTIAFDFGVEYGE